MNQVEMTLENRAKLEELRRRRDSCTKVREGLQALSDEHQRMMHDPWPDEALATAIDAFDIELIGIKALVRRMEVVGR